MNLYSIEIKKFKAIFFQTQFANVTAILVSFILLKKGVYILSGFDPGRQLTLPILGLMVVLAVVHSRYQRKQLDRLVNIEDFDARVIEYERFYKFRMIWFFLSCFVSCLLALLTARYLFLVYAGFDVLVSLPFFPSLLLFKKELRNEEIMLY